MTAPLSRLLAAAALALCVTTGGLAASPAQASPADLYGAQADRRTDHHRTERGLVALRGDRCLRRAAARQAALMAGEGRIFHQALEPVLQRCGLSRVGENVAVGYATGRSVVDQGWMRSAGHRANILTPQHRLGVVVARRGADGRWYAAQLLGAR